MGKIDGRRVLYGLRFGVHFLKKPPVCILGDMPVTGPVGVFEILDDGRDEDDEERDAPGEDEINPRIGNADEIGEDDHHNGPGIDRGLEKEGRAFGTLEHPFLTAFEDAADQGYRGR